MKQLYWDSPDPLDCFDNPNCFFDADGKGKRREPGDPGYVEWFPPGYTPPPKPKAKRSHPIPPRPADIAPHITMSIPYYTRPTPDGSKVMIQIAYRGTKTREEMIAEVQARLTAQNLQPTIENIIRLHDEAIIDFGMDAWKCDPVGHIGHYFAGGGSSDDLQGPWTYQTTNLDLTCFLDEAGELRAESLFVGENLGHKGRVLRRQIPQRHARRFDQPAGHQEMPRHQLPPARVHADGPRLGALKEALGRLAARGHPRGAQVHPLRPARRKPKLPAHLHRLACPRPIVAPRSGILPVLRKG